MFDNLNTTGEFMQVLQASSTDELLAQIKSIKLPVKIVSIYGDSKQHFAWIMTTATIVKKPKQGKEK